MLGSDPLLGSIRAIHEEIRAAVTSACESSPVTSLSRVVKDTEGDTIFSLDRISEGMMVGLFDREFASRTPILLLTARSVAALHEWLRRFPEAAPDSYVFPRHAVEQVEAPEWS